MKIFLLDDSQERWEWLQKTIPVQEGEHELVYCKDVDSARAVLEPRIEDFDLVLLDHDLGTDPKTGRTFLDSVNWLHFGGKLIIHSTNIPAGIAMRTYYLERYPNRRCYQVPFPALNKWDIQSFKNIVSWGKPIN